VPTTAIDQKIDHSGPEAVAAQDRVAGKSVCMLAYTEYECDNRVRRYAETLARRGDRVDVIALSGTRSYQRKEVRSGVTVYRIQYRDHNEKSKWEYAFRNLLFFLNSSLWLARLQAQQRYDVVHIHNMPDFLVFAAWYPKLCGARLILDIHDLAPELFVSKFGAKPSSIYVSILKTIERLSARFVDHLIVSNHIWRETMVERSVARVKCSVFLNHVDSAIFYPRRRSREDGKYVILFHGGFQWHQGLDIAIEAMALVRLKMPEAELHLYGGGVKTLAAELEQLVRRLGLSGCVRFCGNVPLDRIPDVIANADLGVVPKRADSFGNEAYSTKIMEFMSQGVPVVVSRTKVDRFYFDEGMVHFFPSGDSPSLAEAILDVAGNRSLRDGLATRGLQYVERYGWDGKKKEYLDLVDSLSIGVGRSRWYPES
jgi:glycosyltransferase involved in cell wall biosynthesis